MYDERFNTKKNFPIMVWIDNDQLHHWIELKKIDSVLISLMNFVYDHILCYSIQTFNRFKLVQGWLTWKI